MLAKPLRGTVVTLFLNYCDALHNIRSACDTSLTSECCSTFAIAGF